MYTILKDTREKNGWMFKSGDLCLGMELAALKTGDYAIKELPDLLCIERKATPSEVAMNLVSDRIRFHKELDRMCEFKYRYIMCEFDMDSLLTYPKGEVNRAVYGKAKVTGKYLLKLLLEVQINYDVNVLFCGSSYNAFLTAGSLIKRVYEKHSGL